MAIESDFSGRFEVWVHPFPDVEARRWPISTSGGRGPLWSPVRNELYYAESPGRLMVVPFDAATEFKAGSPELLFEYPAAEAPFGRTYDITPDGEQFVVVQPAPALGETAGGRRITVVLNWFEELNRLVPIS